LGGRPPGSGGMAGPLGARSRAVSGRAGGSASSSPNGRCSPDASWTPVAARSPVRGCSRHRNGVPRGIHPGNSRGRRRHHARRPLITTCLDRRFWVPSPALGIARRPTQSYVEVLRQQDMAPSGTHANALRALCPTLSGPQAGGSPGGRRRPNRAGVQLGTWACRPHVEWCQRWAPFARARRAYHLGGSRRAAVQPLLRTQSARKSSQVRWPTARSGARFAPSRNARAAFPGRGTGRIRRRLPLARRYVRSRSASP
jgi:hypothetical protein